MEPWSRGAIQPSSHPAIKPRSRKNRAVEPQKSSRGAVSHQAVEPRSRRNGAMEPQKQSRLAVVGTQHRGMQNIAFNLGSFAQQLAIERR